MTSSHKLGSELRFVLEFDCGNATHKHFFGRAELLARALARREGTIS
jgi:hypothetical protein